MEDKNVAKAMNKYQPPAVSSSPSQEQSPSAFEVHVKQRVKKVPISPERKRKIVRDKVRGGTRPHEPMSHWAPSRVSRSGGSIRSSGGSVRNSGARIKPAQDINHSDSQDLVEGSTVKAEQIRQSSPAAVGPPPSSHVVDESFDEYKDDDFE